ncbi:hypothetical protein SPONL_1689 [uncultured Candidatus Thioglobus sp.]|nr:hypothetical protein SPONL_1689 [uncultured Candidatus Thioglobus sp.]
MNLITDNQQIIASRVDEKLKQDGISVRACADGFNHHFKDAIKGNKTKLINKDSIQRIRNSRFKLPNQHVSELCDYLNVSVEIDANTSLESLLLKKVIEQQPDLKNSISHVLQKLLIQGA